MTFEDANNYMKNGTLMRQVINKIDGLRLNGTIQPERKRLFVGGADHNGKIIYVSNGASGAACLAYSNGIAWLRVLLGAAVSAT